MFTVELFLNGSWHYVTGYLTPVAAEEVASAVRLGRYLGSPPYPCSARVVPTTRPRGL